jgi:penicillin-binding protein 1C
MKINLKKIARRTGIAIGTALLLFFLLDFAFPVDTAIQYSPVVEARDGSVLHVYLAGDQQWRIRTQANEITPEMKKAIIFKEDRYFYYHPGINAAAVSRAIVNNMFYHRRTSGASTITMQVARMLEPKHRSYLNKFIEMFRALQLELHYSKNEILQMYLGLVPYGSNIQGLKTASLLYFNKSPEQLSLAELTTLSIIPNKPNSLVPGKDNAAIMLERNKWLKRFKEKKLFPVSTIDDAMQEPFTASRHDAPAAAPQFCLRMRKTNSAQDVIRTTIDATTQLKAENIVGNYIAELKLKNINNAAVLVVDNQTREVRAYIGSPDFRDKFHHGQVDGVTATRSPGSALKPLLYGLCFDRGLITPQTIIADVPININGYAPENYDLSFRGNISAEDALRNSLNIPAVKMLDKLGTKELIGTMSQAGFGSAWLNRNKLGLSMILGGCGVRLDEMTALYASFANEGNYYPIQFLSDSTQKRSGQKGFQVLSPEATYLLSSVLLELHRPDLPNISDQAQGIPKIAWKTGTSYGRKDAWSIGYNKHYTIGVWVGNFSGEGVPGLSGAGVATPLLFRLFNAIDRNAGDEWLKKPEGISTRFVCKYSGKLPNDYCTDQLIEEYIPGVSSNERCDHLREVYVSADEQFSYCTRCLPASGYKTKTYPNIAPELAAWYDASHIAYEKVPPHNPACTRTLDGAAPVITSLTNGKTYLIADKEEQTLQLSCSVSNDVQKVYWYVNDHFVSASAPGEKVAVKPDGSVLKISCADDKGRYTNINIKVKFI